MSNLVRREQGEYFIRLKTKVNYGTVKRQPGAEVARFEVLIFLSRRFLLLKSTVDI